MAEEILPADAIRAEIRGSDQARTMGLHATAAAPVLLLARKLVAAGFDPKVPLWAYRGSTLHRARARARLPDGGVLCLLLPNDFDSAKTRRHLFADCRYFAAKVVLTKRIAWFKPKSGKRAAPKENHSWFIWHKTARRSAPVILYAGAEA